MEKDKNLLSKKAEDISKAVANDLGKEVKDFRKKNGSLGTLVFYVAIIAAIVGSIVLFRLTISAGTSALRDQFITSRDETANAIYQSFYDAAESKYHVSNKSTINLGSIQEISKLEVFKVIESTCITENDKERENGIYRWTKYRGEGTFTVDLSISEFLLDNDNHHVLIRIPEPALTSFKIIEDDTETFIFVYDKFLSNGSYDQGANLSISFKKRGYSEIKDSIYSNQEYIKKAKESAISELTQLVRLLNSSDEMSDLIVEVEFFK